MASNVRSLAQAWLYAEKARPYAVCAGQTVVGFLMFDYQKGPHLAEIWRFMIGKPFQGQGFGSQALQAAVALLEAEGLFDAVQINYVEDNQGAKHLYHKLGFRETGEWEGNEVVMKLPLPKASSFPAKTTEKATG